MLISVLTYVILNKQIIYYLYVSAVNGGRARRNQNELIKKDPKHIGGIQIGKKKQRAESGGMAPRRLIRRKIMKNYLTVNGLYNIDDTVGKTKT